MLQRRAHLQLEARASRLEAADEMKNEMLAEASRYYKENPKGWKLCVKS